MEPPALIAEHDDLLVVDKPSGWLVHPAGSPDPDLVTWLQQERGRVFAPVHRLDRGASGVTLFAAPDGVERFAAAFREGQVRKRYLALVYGATRAKGVLRRPLQDGRRRRPLDAETRYRTVERFGRWSLLEVEPVTGRHHQIRRHLHGCGHPLIGDERYRPRGPRTVPAFPGRLWLHAAEVTLPDGRRFESPLPPALAAHLDAMRARAAG